MAGKGEVTYEIRGDDSYLESDLSKAEKKVEDHTKKVADGTIKTEKDKSDVVKKEQESVTSNHKQQKSKQEQEEKKSAKTFKNLAKEVSKDAKEQSVAIKDTAIKSIDAIKHPIKTVTSFAGEKTAKIKESFKDSFVKSKEAAITGMEKVSKAILHPVKTAKEAAESIKSSMSDAMNDVGNASANLGKVGAKAIGMGFLSVGTAVVAVGAVAVKGAVDMEKAMNGFLASTGKGVEETEKYQNVLESIYKNNYGDNFEDIASAMEQVTKQLGDMPDEELQTLTESAFALRDVFEFDITESTRAAKAMIDNFGISGDEAMSLIAAGAQNGLDYSGELMDSINEYSVQFAKVGLDADDMFKIFEKGAETGAWNLDKIGDAIKEMSIRVIDGSATTVEGFSTIGLNADEMASKFSQGGESAREAFQQTIDAIASMEDPLAQNTAGVNLFGTMWEDLGPEVVTQLAAIEEGAYDTEDALNGIKEVKYNDLGSMLEGLKRGVELLLLPLGEQLIPILTQLLEAAMPLIEELLTPLTEALGEILPPLMEIIGAILPVFKDLLSALLPPLLEIVGALLPALLEVVNALLPIFDVLLQLLDPIIALFTSLIEPILQLIGEAILPLVESLAPLIEIITAILIPVLELLSSVFKAVFDGMLKDASDRIKNLTNIFSEIVSFVKNIFAGNWKAAWENVKNIFKNIVDGFGSIIKSPINMIIDAINGFTNGLSKIKIPDWVPGVGGKSFSLPSIPRLRVGLDYVPKDEFPAFLHKGERVMTAQENAIYSARGGMANVLSSMGNQPVKHTKEDNLTNAIGSMENKLEMLLRDRGADNSGSEVKVYLEGDIKKILSVLRVEDEKSYKSTGKGFFRK